MSDPSQVVRLVADRGPGLALYARQWLDAASAEDVVQEALTALLTQNPMPVDPVAWMARAVRNAAIDQVRSASRRKRRERVVAEGRREWFEPTPESLIDGQSAEAALRHLPEASREIVVLRIWSGLGFAAIAAVMNLSGSAVHNRYTTALDELRNVMEKPCKNKTT